MIGDTYMTRKSNILAILFLVVLSAFAAADTNISVSPTTSVVAKDDIFTIQVDISTIDSVQFTKFYITFNNTVVETQSLEEAGFLSSAGPVFDVGSSINNAGGFAIFNYGIFVPNTGINGSGHLANITFKAIADGYTNLTINSTKIGDVAGNPITPSVQNGNVTVATITPITINEIMKDPAAVSDAEGEYVELYNPNNFSVDLNGWTLADASTSHTLSQTLNISAYGYLLLCNNGNSSENGGLNCDYDYASVSLNNGDDSVIIKDSAGIEIDRIDYTDAGFPDISGRSMELEDTALDNSNGSNWRSSTVTYGDGDFGTPGSFNVLDTPPNKPVLVAPADTSILVADDVVLSFTATDDDNDTMECGIYGDNETNPTTLIHTRFNVENSSQENYTWGNLADDIYYWKVICNDGIFNSTASDIYRFKIDASAPMISNLNKTPEPSYNDDIAILSANVTDDYLDEVFFSVRINNGNWSNHSPTSISGDIHTYNLAGLANQEEVDWKVSANDTLGNMVESPTQSFTVANRAPQLVSNISIPAWDEGGNVTFDISANFVDPDGDNLTYDVEVDPSDVFGTLNGSDGTGVLSSPADFFGNDTIQFNVADPYGGVNYSNIVSLTVNPINDAPYFTSVPTTSATEAIQYSYDANGNDIDSNVSELAFSVIKPGNAQINPVTGIFTWTPTAAQIGITEVEITINDTEGANASQKFNVTVLPALDIINMEVTYNGNNEAVSDGDIIGNVKPAQTITVDYTVMNRFPATSLVGITVQQKQNVTGTQVVNTTASFNLNGGATKDLSYTFNVPYITTGDHFSVELDVAGKDLAVPANDYASEKSIFFNINKSSHDIAIVNKGVLPNNLTCNRETQIEINVSNKGLADEDVTISVTAPSGISISAAQTQTVQSNNQTVYSFDLDARNMTAGTYTLTIDVSYQYGFYTFDETVDVLVNGCLDTSALEADAVMTENEPSNWSIDLKNYTVGDITGISYAVASTDAALNCSVAGSDFTCAAPQTGFTGIVPINITVTQANTITNDQFDVTINDKNFAPVAHDINANVNEDGIVGISLNCSDLDNDTLTYATTNPTNGTLSGAGDTVTYIPDVDFNGIDSFNYTCNDGITDGNTALVTVNIISVLDKPSIGSASPVGDLDLLIGDDVTQRFNISLNDPDAANPLVIWYVDEIEALNGTTVFNFLENTEDTYEVSVKLWNDTKTEVYDSYAWDIIVSETPVTVNFLGTINNVNPGNVNNFTGLTIYNTYAKIDFGSQPIDLSDVVDVDSNVRLESGIAGIDSNVFGFSVFGNHSATITMYNLPYSSAPDIYYNNGFQTTGTNVCNAGSDPKCTNIVYNNGTLTFTVDHFTLFFLPAPNNPPQITSNPKVTGYTGEAYSYDVDATDADADVLTYSLTTKPAGMTINSATGIISWTPNATGSSNVVVSVTDGEDADSQSFSVSVSEKAKLVITDLDVKVGGKSEKNVADGDTISKEAEPGDLIVLDLELGNTFDTDIDIEDVQVEVTVENIDDEDDIDLDADIDQIKDGKEERVELEFDVPLKTDEDTYAIVIHAEGDDEDGLLHEVDWTVYLKVEKENHKIAFYEASVSPSKVSCAATATISVGLINTGGDTEDVDLTLSNDALDINEVDAFELDEDIDDADNEYERTFNFRVDSQVKPGSYPIQIEAEYDNGDEVETASVLLTVDTCVLEEPEEQEEDDRVDVQVTPGEGQQTEAGSRPSTTKISFRDTTDYLFMLAIVFIILVGLVAYAVGATIIISRRR